MKLANVPTCPFPTYRVSLTLGFGAAKVREIAKVLEGKKGRPKKRVWNEDTREETRLRAMEEGGGARATLAEVSF